MLNKSISWKSTLNIQAANPRMAIDTIALKVLPQLLISPFCYFSYKILQIVNRIICPVPYADRFLV